MPQQRPMHVRAVKLECRDLCGKFASILEKSTERLYKNVHCVIVYDRKIWTRTTQMKK